MRETPVVGQSEEVKDNEEGEEEAKIRREGATTNNKSNINKSAFISVQTSFLLAQTTTTTHEAKRGEKARSKGTTKPSKLGSNRKPVWRIAQRKGESRIEWENIIGKKLKI